MIRSLFYKSKWIHRYLGLALIVYGIIMGVSGIFVNHPNWIDGVSIPLHPGAVKFWEENGRTVPGK